MVQTVKNRRPLIQAAVRTPFVVVGDVLIDRSLQMLMTKDQNVVKAFEYRSQWISPYSPDFGVAIFLV